MRKRIIALGAVVAALVAVALVALSQSASAATSTVTQSSGWDFSETRTAGHYQFTSAGLHVWTDDATSQAKVAGYSPPGAVSTSLSAVAAGPEPSLNWSGTSPQPGYQLVISTDDGIKILVGEPVYGDKWWMPNSYCNTWCDTLSITYSGGGGGSAHSATLDQWSAALDESNVIAIGFSLGSGVHGDGTLRSLTLGNDCYRFGADVVVPSTSTTTTTTTTGSSTSSSTTTTSETSDTSSSSSSATATDSSSSATSTTTSNQTVGHVGNESPIDVGTVGEKGLAYTGTSDQLPIILWIGILAVVAGLVLIFVYRRRSSRSGDHRS